jgi:hypothetical protein
MFKELKQFIESEGVGNRSDYEPHLAAIRRLKQDEAHRLWFCFINHLGGYEQYSNKLSSRVTSGLSDFLSREPERDISLNYDFICEVFNEVFADEGIVLPIVKPMLKEGYQPPKDIEELYHHLFVLLLYYALPLNNTPILTDLKMDIAMSTLSFAVGEFTQKVDRKAVDLPRRKSIGETKDKSKQVSQDRIRQVLSGMDTRGLSKTALARRVKDDIENKWDMGEYKRDSRDVATYKRDLVEMGINLKE